jgi:outer membrane protein assembly factor BamD
MTMLNLSLRRVAALAFLTTLVAAAAAQTPATPATTTATPQSTDTTVSNAPTPRKKRVAKTDRVQQSKDTKAAVKKDKKIDPLVAKDAQLPDKQLYDKALAQQKSGHFDVARLDLQTLLNTYPDSQYQMKAKLAVADTWYREGGSAALTQAEQEYNDFITFFPTAPEAAEAQMRVGDIYFKQMDVPDRDYQKGMKAEDAYRTMLKVYPDAPAKLLTECKQKLREVQEVLATREADLAAFYSTHANWPATIARYQTVIDTYPQYSHMDDALIGLGDAYEAEATIIRSQPGLPEGARAELLQKYDGQAADAYRKVVLYHYAAPHVEDAKERLTAMNLPVPRPTAEQVAASEALEGSRAQYTLRKKLELLVLHKPDTVTAAGAGDPPLEDAAPTTAPTIVRNIQRDYVAALDPKGAAAAAAAAAAAPVAADKDKIDTPVLAAPDPNAKPTLSDVAAPGQGSSDGSITTMESAPASSGRSGTGIGVEVLTPGVTVGTGASNLPAATGAPDPNNGLSTVGPKNTSALPPVVRAADAPDQVNDAAGAKLPAAQVKDPNSKKKPKAPAVDKTDESSSKKKPKKGLDKLNPF